MPAYPLTMLLVFAMTLYTSATLLMMVQPIIGKMITPLLGGTPAVWNTCMVFFQAILLAGYAYSHLATKYLGVRKQSILHLVLLGTPFLFFPLAVNRDLILGGLDNPIPQLLLLLITSVGVPFFVLSTSAPLLQKWFSSTTHPAAKDPYFLYAASNTGSMLALISYPTLIEPNLRLSQQTWSFVAGYALLVVLIAISAAFMWLSPAAKPEPEFDAEKERENALALASVTAASEGIQTAGAREGIARGRDKKNKRANRYDSGNGNEFSLTQELTGEVTWLRRLRWVALAAVPSSLMLGATTYMTTDIAAIPLLWVLPLAIYLVSFIIVFAKISPLVQSVMVWFTIEAVCGFVIYYADATGLPPFLVLALRILLTGGVIYAFKILLWVRTPDLIRSCFILLLPLTLLLLIFMMLSDIKPTRISNTIAIHLGALFVVSMVCHGELARNRPSTKYLTEFFLWMSFGGVVGGMFNGLLAPVIFNGIVEYQFAMVVACLLAPPLGFTAESSWGTYADLGLAALCLTVGSLLIGLRLWENDIPFDNLANAPYYWLSAGLVLMAGLALFSLSRIKDNESWWWGADIVKPLGLTFGVVALNVLGLWVLYLLTPHGKEGRSEPTWWGFAFLVPALMVACVCLNASAVYGLFKTRTNDKRLQAWLDVLLPFAVLLLVVGLIWGIPTAVLYPRLDKFSKFFHQMPSQVRVILTYGVPAVLCYTFVERSLRFGLSVGAVMLAAAFTGIFDESTIYQERSFFGVLKVEFAPPPTFSHRLVHGTTLHGTQFLPLPKEYEEKNPELADRDTIPLTYYHRTGPIGAICQAYNAADRNLAVIGLGTGTMSCYAEKDQHVTFYDIDPVVRKITWASDKYFTFLKQARDRGADMDLVMGDARLTMERKKLDDKDKYHILVVDAFSSDAIPIHLITYEALLMFLDHMAEDGLVCFHVSNRYLDLKPVLGNLANKYRKEGKGNLVAYYMNDGEDEPGKAASTWVVLARDEKYVEKLQLVNNWDKHMGLKNADDKNPAHQWDVVKPVLQALCVPACRLEPRWFPAPVTPEVGEWTDDYAPIFRVFSW